MPDTALLHPAYVFISPCGTSVLAVRKAMPEWYLALPIYRQSNLNDSSTPFFVKHMYRAIV
jgi:hypothetical protein